MSEVGYASLGIIPSFDGFERNLQRGASGPMASVGGTSGRTFGDAAGKTAGSRFGSAFKSAAKVGLIGIGALGVGAFKLAGDAVSAASDLEESTNKVREVFGKGADDVLRFSSKAADALGQTNVAARDAAATFGLFGNLAGLSEKKSAKFSKRMTTLASDLASFHNTEPEQAVEALGAALRGESEPIRSFGVLLDEATLKAEAMRLGLLKPVKDQAKIRTYQVNAMKAQKELNEATAEFGPKSLEALDAQAKLGSVQGLLQKATEGTIPPLTQQQKVLAAQSSIFKQTEVAQGDFARTSDGLANQQRRLRARFEDAKASLGTGLLPIMTDAADFLLDKGIPAFEDFSDWFNKTGLPAIRDFGGDVKDVAGEVKTLIDRIADLPGSLKLALAVGGVGTGLAARKGLQGAAGFLGKNRGATPANPLYVFTTNGGGAGGLGGKKGLLGLGAATLPTALLATAVVGILAAPQVGAWLAEKEADFFGVDKKPKNRPKDSAAAGTDLHADIIADRFRTGGAAVDAYNDKLSNTRDRIIEMTNGAGNFIGKAETLRDHLTVITNGATVPFKAPGLDDVLTKSKNYKGILEGIPRTVRTDFIQSVQRNNVIEPGDGRGGKTPAGVSVNIYGDVRPADSREFYRDVQRRSRSRAGGGR